MFHDWWNFDVIGITIVHAEEFLNARSFIVGLGLTIRYANVSTIPLISKINSPV
jgi:uncharacterized protein YuzE